MNEALLKKTLGFIGIAKKAGMLICGEQLSLKALEENKVRLLIIACDASDKIKRHISSVEKIYSARCMYLPYDMKTLGKIVGLKSCAVCAVCDTKIAAELADRLAEMSEDDKDRIMAAKLKLARHRQIERQIKKKEAELSLGEKKRSKKALSEKHKSRSKNELSSCIDGLVTDLNMHKPVKLERAVNNINITNTKQKERGSR